MSGGVLQISSDTIDLAFIILVYVLVALVVYRWLAPKIARRRPLAGKRSAGPRSFW